MALERLALTIVPAFAAANLFAWLLGLWLPLHLTPSLLTLDVDCLEWLVTPLILALAGTSAVGALWGGGWGGGGWGGWTPPPGPSDPVPPVGPPNDPPANP
ncbi:MAG: hypothetical protein K6V97_03720 [Actinomycetia bacterium]|nr:hypothetical protein [Actinomycetes bacterium]